MSKAKKNAREKERQAYFEADRRLREDQDKGMDTLGLILWISALALLSILVVSSIVSPRQPPNTDPRVGWVVTESNDFGPVYRHKCEGTTLIIEHTSRGVHTPTYFENDPKCVSE